MQYRTIKKTDDCLSALDFGLMRLPKNGRGTDREQATRQIRRETTSPRSRKYYMITEYGRKIREKMLASLGSMNAGPETAKAGYGGRSKCTRS